MLTPKRRDKPGLKPLAFVANDYALACYGLDPITDPKALFTADILEQEFVDWVESSYLLKTAFREVAVLGGAGDAPRPRKPQRGRPGPFLTDPSYNRHRPLKSPGLFLSPARRDGWPTLTH